MDRQTSVGAALLLFVLIGLALGLLTPAFVGSGRNAGASHSPPSISQLESLSRSWNTEERQCNNNDGLGCTALSNSTTALIEWLAIQRWRTTREWTVAFALTQDVEASFGYIGTSNGNQPSLDRAQGDEVTLYCMMGGSDC
jgi:hypothetical protein